MDLWLQEGRLGMGIARDGHVPLLYFKWINKALLYSTGNSAQCYVAACMGGRSGGEEIPVCMWLSPFSAHLKLSQHC